MTNFWLIRHGEPVDTARGRCYGALDVELSESGRAEIARVANLLREKSISAVYTSPLSRAKESANAIAAVLNCAVEVVQGFREINFGNFEGLSYCDIESRYPEVYEQWMRAPTEVRFPNGETFLEMRGRVLDSFDRIRSERAGESVAIVSHGGTNRILIARALQMPDSAIFQLAQDYAAVNLLSYTGDFASLRMMNSRC